MSRDREFHAFAFPTGKCTLDNEVQWKAFIKYLAGADGNEITICAYKRRSKRSLAQNAGYHAMITPWALDSGYSIDDLKDEMLRICFGTREVVSPLTGEVRIVLTEPHTSTLTVAQFHTLIEETLRVAAECGCVLEPPDEYTARKTRNYIPDPIEVDQRIQRGMAPR